jgi:hypothetical protein
LQQARPRTCDIVDAARETGLRKDNAVLEHA